MIKTNFFKNNFLIIIFSIFIFFFQLHSLQNITPHHDQTFHINWLINLKNSDHLLPPDFGMNFESLKYDVVFASEFHPFTRNLYQDNNATAFSLSYQDHSYLSLFLIATVQYLEYEHLEHAYH